METRVSNLDLAAQVEACAESPAKEQLSAKVSSEDKKTDPIPAFPQNVHPAIKAIVAPFPESRRPAMAIMSLAYLGTMAGNARFLYRNLEEHATGFECCLVASQAMGKSALTRQKRNLAHLYLHDITPSDLAEGQFEAYEDWLHALHEVERIYDLTLRTVEERNT